MLYFELFLSFLQIGLSSIGGGYAAIPLIQSQVVENHAWLTMAEFTDLVTIAERRPYRSASTRRRRLTFASPASAARSSRRSRASCRRW